uniref:Uncharacterized protein n=1 Tax=Avena sativa TaxID=4498 RepID=A0ACD5YW05_AVESA
MGLRDIEMTLPPGFRFYPSDEELVCHYLHSKVANQHRFAAGASPAGAMVEVDLHVHEPWELPDVAKLSTDEWYFFSFRDRKYATGLRTNRATKSGYWKATGKDRVIRRSSSSSSGRADIVGMRKTLVFYHGRAPNGAKSCWVMHEFRIEDPHSPPKEDWVLCRVFYKNKVDTEYAMDSQQETTIAGDAAVKGYNHVEYHDPEYHHPPVGKFPSLVSHRYQLPLSSSHDHHRLSSMDAFSSMPPVVNYDNVLGISQHLDGGSRGAAGPRDNNGGDQCGGVLVDLVLQEDRYNYDSLL